jgi:hypothetical protein
VHRDLEHESVLVVLHLERVVDLGQLAGRERDVDDGADDLRHLALRALHLDAGRHALRSGRRRRRLVRAGSSRLGASSRRLLGVDRERASLHRACASDSTNTRSVSRELQKTSAAVCVRACVLACSRRVKKTRTNSESVDAANVVAQTPTAARARAAAAAAAASENAKTYASQSPYAPNTIASPNALLSRARAASF